MIEPYSRTDIDALLNACAENAQWTTRKEKEVKSEREWKLRDRAIILVLIDTGIRAQELCDLVVKDYENKLGRLQIRHGKGNKSRMVFMGETARRALWRYLADRTDLRPADRILATRNSTAMDTAALSAHPRSHKSRWRIRLLQSHWVDIGDEKHLQEDVNAVKQWLGKRCWHR